MSRVGKKPIALPAGVKAEIRGQQIEITGAKTALSTSIHEAVTVVLQEIDGQSTLVLSVQNPDDVKQAAQWGTARAIIANLVEGIQTGFTKTLEINGVGYRANVSGSNLVLLVGFSHEVKFPIPEGLTITVAGNLITISGANKELVGETAARIRRVRKPEPYKGKGIKYTTETIRRKAGKASKGE